MIICASKYIYNMERNILRYQKKRNANRKLYLSTFQALHTTFGLHYYNIYLSRRKKLMKVP